MARGPTTSACLASWSSGRLMTLSRLYSCRERAWGHSSTSWVAVSVTTSGRSPMSVTHRPSTYYSGCGPPSQSGVWVKQERGPSPPCPPMPTSPPPLTHLFLGARHHASTWRYGRKTSSALPCRARPSLSTHSPCLHVAAAWHTLLWPPGLTDQLSPHSHAVP